MATTSCWRCLLRPSLSSQLHAVDLVTSRLAAMAPFSTGPSLHALPPKKSVKGPVKGVKGTKTLRIKKKAFVKSGRPPAPGERKALRKRIVLSNSNALEVEDMVDMTADAVASHEQIGKVLGLPDAVVDQLRAVEAFKTTQGWGLFRRPAVLVRDETIRITKMMQKAEQEKLTDSLILDGERGTGKSIMLLQTMATAFTRNWIVIPVAEAQELTTAVTDYAPIPGTTPLLYSQNTYAATWLGQIGKANNEILKKHKLTKRHTLPIPIQPDITLARLVELGARDPDVAWPFFQALWSELTTPGKPPILLTLDGLSHIMRDSAYRSPDYKPVHAHDLSIIRHFVDYFSGTSTLPNGGMAVAATTKGNTPRTIALDLAIKQKQDADEQREVTQKDPWTTYDERSLSALSAARLVSLKGLSKQEARGLMEYWAASGVLRQCVDEKSVAERWAVAGNGVVGELERGALKMWL